MREQIGRGELGCVWRCVSSDPVFAGAATVNRAEMVRFMADTLGLDQVHVEGVDANLFELPDGSRFAVAHPRGMGDTSRSIGFLVDSLEQAAEQLRAAGIDTDVPAENATHRYLHFRAPDGELYELIENRTSLRVET